MLSTGCKGLLLAKFYCRRREPATAEEALEGPLRRTDNAILLKSQVEEENEEIERVQNKR